MAKTLVTSNNPRSRSKTRTKASGNKKIVAETLLQSDVAISPEKIPQKIDEDKEDEEEGEVLIESGSLSSSDKLDHSHQATKKKRDANELPLVSSPPPPNKRRRMHVTIQRQPNEPTVGTQTIPTPPLNMPPIPTKFLKILVLGPAGRGKREWVQLLPSQPKPSTKVTSTDASAETSVEPSPVNPPVTVNYHSKDYSFQSSAALNETVRLHMYNVDCVTKAKPPSSWRTTLIPSMQHIVLVVDLFGDEEQRDVEKSLLSWKTWLERHMMKSWSKVPISLILVDNSKKTGAANKQAWDRLGATVEKLCQKWPINKWYKMEDTTSSHVVLQTLIERTWSAMDTK